LYIRYGSETAEMAGSPLISFRGRRDPNGYHLAESAEYGPVILPNSDRREWCEPLTGEEFRIFASIAGTPEGALGFVRRYGPVTMAYHPTIGDRVEAVRRSARDMRRLLDAMSKEAQMSEELQDALLSGSLSAIDLAFVWDPSRRAPTWSFRPTSLCSALWLQFGQAMMRGVQLRVCLHCGDWFETGVGTGRRADAKFCSDKHRVALNSLKRSKGE
jgi:hypothetical protein